MTLHEYYEEYWSRDEPSPISDPLADARLALLMSHLSDEHSVVVDAGSGDGKLVRGLAERGFSATGFDIAQVAVDLARSRVPSATFERHSVEDLPWPITEGSQDAVVAFEVIEHLLRPAALIQGARHALRPGGHLALTTPFHGRLKNLVVSLLAFDHHFAPEGDHIRFFSDRALRSILTRNGFEVEAIHHFGRFAPLWAGVFVWARKK
jgi:2-polyprenyl-3-methyl-5-hydroxy-6-metoxy-1,4-benzoquinol methylase